MSKIGINDILSKSVQEGLTSLENKLKDIDSIIANIGKKSNFKEVIDANKSLLQAEKMLKEETQKRIALEKEAEKIVTNDNKEKRIAQEKLLKEETRKRIAVEKEAEKEVKKLVEAENKLQKEEARLIELQNKQVKSLKELAEWNSLLVKKRQNLIVNSKETRQEFNQLTTAIAKNTAELKIQDAMIGRHQRNVGDYGRAIKGLSSAFVGLLGAFGLMGGLQMFATLMSSAFNDMKVFSKAVSNFSAITGIAGKNLDNMRQKAIEMGKDVEGGASAVIESYKLIASANSALSGSPSAIAEISKQAIILSQASGETLQNSTTQLMQILNKMGVEAKDSAKTLDILAASAKWGTAEIPQTTEALLVMGGTMKLVAKNTNSANDNVREANSLIQVLANKGKIGADAGTGLRNVLLKLAAVDVLPKEAISQLTKAGVNMKMLKDTTIPLSDRLKELGKISGNAAALAKVFGTENLEVGKVILDNTKLFDDYNVKLNENGVASEQAGTNMNNLSGDLVKAKSAWTSLMLSLESGQGVIGNLVRETTKAWTNLLNVLALSENQENKNLTLNQKRVMVNGQYKKSVEETTVAINNRIKVIENESGRALLTYKNRELSEAGILARKKEYILNEINLETQKHKTLLENYGKLQTANNGLLDKQETIDAAYYERTSKARLDILYKTYNDISIARDENVIKEEIDTKKVVDITEKGSKKIIEQKAKQLKMVQDMNEAMQKATEKLANDEYNRIETELENKRKALEIQQSYAMDLLDEEQMAAQLRLINAGATEQELTNLKTTQSKERLNLEINQKLEYLEKIKEIDANELDETKKMTVEQLKAVDVLILGLKLKQAEIQTPEAKTKFDLSKYIQESLGLNDEEFSKAKAAISDFLNEAMQLIDSYFEAAKNKQDQIIADSKNEQSVIQSNLDKELDSIEQKKRAGVAYSDFTKKRLEKELIEQKRREQAALRERQRISKIQKGIDIAQAIGGGAIAVVNALKEKFPFNLILAALIAGTVGLQIAKISSAKYEKGGSFIAKGKSHAEGGINIGGNKEIEGNEAVSVFSKNATKKHYPLIKQFTDAVNKNDLKSLNKSNNFAQVINIDNSKSDKYLQEIAKNTSVRIYINQKGERVIIENNNKTTIC